MSSQASFLLQKVAPFVIREIAPHITSRVTPLITEKVAIPIAKKVGLPIVRRIGIPIARKAGSLFITKVGYPIVNKVFFNNNPNTTLSDIGAIFKTGTAPAQPSAPPVEAPPIPPVVEKTKKRRSLREMIMGPKKVKVKPNTKPKAPKTNPGVNVLQQRLPQIQPQQQLPLQQGPLQQQLRYNHPHPITNHGNNNLFGKRRNNYPY